MRNRDFFIPSITTLILFGFVWFLSCAHQNRWKDEADADFNEPVEEQLNYAENADVSSEESSEPAEKKSEPLAENLDAFSGEKTESSAETSQAASNAFAFDSSDTDSSFSLGEEASKPESLAQNSAEAPPAQDPPSADPVSPPLPTEGTLAAQPEIESNEMPALTEDGIAAEEVEPALPQKKKIYWSGKLPAIPSQAVMRKGAKLNRFYFSRLGDTPKSVSKLIYSDTKHAKKLVSWNGGNWKPGKIIYYLSPIEPKDARMGSFYKERSIEPEEYSVKSGDWLTRIAKLKLGSTLSWKEIGVINGLKKPNALEVGERLAIYPKDLLNARRKKPEQLAQAPVAAEESGQLDRFEEEPISPSAQMAQAPTTQTQLAPQPQPQFEAQPQAQLSPPPAPAFDSQPPSEEAPIAEPSSQPEMDWRQLIEQESVAILIGAALVILLLALRVRKKRLKNKGSGSGSSSESDYREEPPKYGKGR